MEPFGAFFGTKCTPYLEARQKARSGVKGLKLFPSVAIFWTSVSAVTTSLYRSAEPERQSFSFGTDVVD